MPDLRPAPRGRTGTWGEDGQPQLRAVTELARDLAGRFDVQPLLGRVLAHAVTLLGCESGSLSLVDEAGGTYTKHVDHGVGCQEGRTFSLREGVTGEVVRTRQTVVLHSYSTIAGGHVSPEDPRWERAVIGVPIMWDDRVVGSLVIFSAEEDRLFTTSDVQVAELFADHAAIALANARAHAAALEQAPDGLPGHDPQPLRGLTLAQTVADDVAGAASTSPATVGLTVVGAPRDLPPGLRDEVCRLVRLALGHATGPARATQVRVGLVFGPYDVSVVVQDDGDASWVPGATALVGVDVDVDARPGGDTRVRVVVPDRPAPGPSRPGRAAVLVAGPQPLVVAGLTRLLGTHAPAVHVVAEVGTTDDLVAAQALLRPAVALVVLDQLDAPASSVLEALREADPDVAVVAVLAEATLEQLRTVSRSGVRGLLTPQSDGDTVARVVTAAAEGRMLADGDVLGCLAAEPGADVGPSRLTPREREVRDLVVRGMADKQVATALRISVKTVEKHVGSLLRKTGASNRTMLVSRSGPDRSG